MSILEPRDYYKPFHYGWAFAAYEKAQSMHWLPHEAPLAEDIKDWNQRLTVNERQLLTQLFRFFTQADVDVARGYVEKYLPRFPHPELRMMLLSFGAAEANHVHAYSQLIDTLGIPEAEYKAFQQYEAMAAKHSYMFERETGKSIADLVVDLAVFSAFGEGMQLFSSFALLMNFQRRGLMKGMTTIVEWSIRDECYSDDTEILTTAGWKLFNALTPTDKVAQFDPATREINFIIPKRIVSYERDGEMVEFSYPAKRGINFKVTPSHTTLIYNQNGQPIVRAAEDFKSHNRLRLPVAGYKQEGSLGSFTPEHALWVALQADGSIPEGEYRNGNHCGHRRVGFSLKRPRKIERLLEIGKAAGVEVTELKGDHRGHRSFAFNIPVGVTKLFSSWVDLSEVTAEWADGFMRELVHWDGHIITPSKFYYSTVVPENADYVQAIAALGGWRTSRSIQVDDRSDSYRDVHRVWFQREDTFALSTSIKPTKVPYQGKVWCVESETGFLVVRRQDAVCISGNTHHVESMVRLTHEVIREHPRVWNDETKQRVYQTCRDMVNLEDAFIDQAYALIPPKEWEAIGATPAQAKQYIRYIADRRLNQLGLKMNYGTEIEPIENPFPWLDWIMNAPTHTNFFEQRATEYGKGEVHGWDTAYDFLTAPFATPRVIHPVDA